MQYTISVAPNGKYIIIKYVGDLTSQLAIGPTIEAHELGKKIELDRFLVDATESKNVDRVPDNYDYVHTKLESAPINKTARVAILVRPDDHSHDFVVTVSRNSNLSVVLFTDRALADWHLCR